MDTQVSWREAQMARRRLYESALMTRQREGERMLHSSEAVEVMEEKSRIVRTARKSVREGGCSH
jgi:hypothetical protein